MVRQQRLLNSLIRHAKTIAVVAELAVCLPLSLPLPLAARPIHSHLNAQTFSTTNFNASRSAASFASLDDCRRDSTSMQLNCFVNGWMQAANWLMKPEMGLGLVVERFGPQLIASLNPSPWPGINQQARLARVPVIMYHDILPKKEVFFDVTPQELDQHLRLLQENGVTPISLDQLVSHLRTGLPLPEKPILLTFDDGYGGHYKYVYPLLKKYRYPAVFAIYTAKVGVNTGRTHVTWEQLRQMAVDPLVTISSHSVTHPLDLRPLSDNQLQIEIMLSKRILESQLGIPIRYFTYPSGKFDARVTNLVGEAGYEAALTMNDHDDRFAGQSKSLLAIERIGQSRLNYAIARSWGGSMKGTAH